MNRNPELFFEMLRIRMVEEEVKRLLLKKEINCPTHLYIGEEAVGVGVCSVLKKEDLVYSTYRGHGHYLAKGGDLTRFFAELFGKDSGCAKGRGGSMHLVDKEAGFVGTSALVGGCIPLAVGSALAFSLRKEQRVAVVFFGDGATEEGVFYESLNFASLRKLPVILVCENNFWAVNSPVANRQPQNAPIYKKAEGFGIAGFRVDGNNVLNVVSAAAFARERAISGNGPTLIEAQTYRWSVHVEHYEEIGKRLMELEHWRKLCPIEEAKFKLGIWDGVEGRMRLGIREEIERAVDAARRMR